MGRVIRHVEHYANSGDFVSKIGVLQFSRQEEEEKEGPPFLGRVFERKEATGHLLNQHYLDEMFAMEGGCVAEENAFMDSLIDPGAVNEGDEGGNRR